MKRNTSGAFPVGPEARPGGSFGATNATLESIIRFAYDLPGYRIVGGPGWVRGPERFDIEARAGREVSVPELRRMVQSLLRDRFQLVVHAEEREMATYTLVLARSDGRLGSNLRQSDPACALPGNRGSTLDQRISPNGGVSTQRTCTAMDALVSSLSATLAAPVDDKTGLTGRWDYELTYLGAPRRNAPAASQDPNEAPVLVTAVQEQLGLKLEAGRGPVNVLAIESAVAPSEN